MVDAFFEALMRGAPLPELEQLANAMTEEQRHQLVRALSPRQLRALFQVAEGGSPLEGTGLLVPPDTPGGKTVEWVGQNSLPLFRAFTKRFTRSRRVGELTGYNTGATQALVGPGYFTVRVRPEAPGELLFDYTAYPEAAPPGWPPLEVNERGISRWVFANLQDRFRPVGLHLGIGGVFSARGRPRHQHFALARGATLPFGV